MAPYAYAIVGVFFLTFLIHLVLRFTQYKKDYLWYRQLWTYKSLPEDQKSILKEFDFYKNLNPKHKKQFEHRTAQFIADKSFRHRYNTPLTAEQITLIAAVGVQLSFGRRNYLYPMLSSILIFDEAFQSSVNQNFHKGEYNPKAKVMALSWEDFKTGMDITNDNLHLGLHEFTHVMHFESERTNTIDAMRFEKYHHKILKSISHPEIRERLNNTRFFRDYAFTNQYEFMAVLTEYFFESPQEFEELFPELYFYLKKALLYKKEWLVA